jgi:Phage integrase, N-terminal SAM-like domain
VTHLRKLTLDEIARRNYTEGTTRAYLRIIEDLARYFHRSPDLLGPDQLREYTAHLFRDRKLSDNSVNQIVGALRFFFRKVLKRPWDWDEMPYPKKKIHLPVIWSPEEVSSLIDAAPIPFYRTIVMTLYGTGVRRAECAALKLTDIDSARMVCMSRTAKAARTATSCSAPICATNYAHIIADWPANPPCGCSPAAAGIPPITPSATRSSGTPAVKPPNAPASTSRSIRTPCATASPHICSKAAPTCVPFNCSSATPT